jgi:hypothetical protein
MIRRLSLLLLASVLAIAAHAQTIVVGQSIGVDIGAANGWVSNWTLVTSFTSGLATQDMTTGTAISDVTVAFATSGTSAGGGFNNLGGYPAGNAINTVSTAITTDGAYGTATGTNALTLTFSGLDNSLTYTLEVFSVAAGLPTFNDADTPIINGVATNWATGFTSRAARYAKTTGATFAGLSTDGAGNLSFAISDALHSNAIMNGAILTATASAVPEPSTYAALAGLAALGFVAWRRRRA